jgi:uncharacterized C2H2 Zn-finger protein
MMERKDRVWVCIPCGDKPFRDKTDLARHVESKHVTAPVVCPICDKSIKTRISFTKHMHKFHPGVPYNKEPLFEME